MSTLLTSWAHYWDTQLCASYIEQRTVKLKERKLHLSKERHLASDVPASGCMGDHTSTFLLISGEATALDTDRKRKRGDSLPRGTLPTTRSSKSPQVTGPWELDTVPGEEGKNRELASGASWGETYYRCITPRGHAQEEWGENLCHTPVRSPSTSGWLMCAQCGAAIVSPLGILGTKMDLGEGVVMVMHRHVCIFKAWQPRTPYTIINA